jgi:putative membrane fusion protein
MSKTISRWIAGFVTLVLAMGIGYGLYQVIMQNRRAPRTLRAVITHVDEGVDLFGMLVRDETVLTKEAGRSYVLLVSSGERVSAKQAVGVSFSSKTDAETYRQIRQLASKISDLSDPAGQGTAMDIVTYNRKIKSQTEDLVADAQLGKFDTPLTEIKQMLGRYLTLRNMAVEADSNSGSALLALLKDEQKALKASISESGQYVYTKNAGYFCRYVDGREQLFTPEQVLAMTPEEFEKVKQFPAQTISEDEVLGKLVGGHGWYFAAIVSEKESKLLEKGKEYTLDLAETRMKATLQSVKAGENGTYLAVFYSQVPLPDVTLYREQPCQIVLNSYEGVKVPVEALRMNNGVTGVYVLEGARAVFKQVDILYTGDSYYLVSVGTENRKQLFINDRIIIGVKDLYDGKVIS